MNYAKLEHLHNELLAVLTLAKHVEDRLAIGITLTQMLRIQILHILHHLLSVEQAIQKANQQLLIRSRPENSFEAEVGQQTDVSVSYRICQTTGC